MKAKAEPPIQRTSGSSDRERDLEARAGSRECRPGSSARSAPRRSRRRHRPPPPPPGRSSAISLDLFVGVGVERRGPQHAHSEASSQEPPPMTRSIRRPRAPRKPTWSSARLKPRSTASVECSRSSGPARRRIRVAHAARAVPDRARRRAPPRGGRVVPLTSYARRAARSSAGGARRPRGSGGLAARAAPAGSTRRRARRSPDRGSRPRARGHVALEAARSVIGSVPSSSAAKNSAYWRWPARGIRASRPSAGRGSRRRA